MSYLFKISYTPKRVSAGASRTLKLSEAEGSHEHRNVIGDDAIHAFEKFKAGLPDTLAIAVRSIEQLEPVHFS